MAGDTGWPDGDAVAVRGAVDGHLVHAELGGDVGEGAPAVQVLRSQPVRVDGGGLMAGEQGDAGLAGMLGNQLLGQAGLAGDLCQALAGGEV
jgi:phosphoenolpyruvate carboxylase